MEQIELIARSGESGLAPLEAQSKRCAELRCILLGEAGCVLNGILTNSAKRMLAEPCANAVERLPHRRFQKIAETN